MASEPEYCNPNNTSKTNFSCFSENQIYAIINRFNQLYPNNKIRCVSRPISACYGELKEKLSQLKNKKLKNEWCWTEDKDFSDIFKNTKKLIFVPKMPSEWCPTIKKWREQRIDAPWLSNFDIDDVLTQYDKKYPGFEFLGTFPIDFYKKKKYGCVSHLCNFNINEIVSRNKYAFGLVLNTDSSDGPGEHWISLYCNINKKCMYFFNSATNIKTRIPPEIIEFARSIMKQIKDLYKVTLNFKFNNKKKHQMSNSECGMYAIYFILCMLDADEVNGSCDKEFEQYFNNPTHTVTDALMVQKRQEYFRPNCECDES
tara:strand:+ start:1154 stop:2095 length:942 start_codon:yes stop_codon:yes gene_type:complete